METVTIYFSDGSSLQVKEDQSFMSINSFSSESDNLNFAAQDKVFKLWWNNEQGLIPSVLELLFNSEYFFKIDSPSIVYNSKSVTRIQK